MTCMYVMYEYMMCPDNNARGYELYLPGVRIQRDFVPYPRRAYYAYYESSGNS